MEGYIPSTVSFADLYGNVPPGRKPGQTQPADTENASGGTGGIVGTRPAYFWVALVGMLVFSRILYEKGTPAK